MLLNDSAPIANVTVIPDVLTADGFVMAARPMKLASVVLDVESLQNQCVRFVAPVDQPEPVDTGKLTATALALTAAASADGSGADVQFAAVVPMLVERM